MALDKAGLKANIVTLLTDMLTREETSIEEFADRLANAIDVFVKTGKVAVGITVTTAGSATAQTGQTTSEGVIS